MRLHLLCIFGPVANVCLGYGWAGTYYFMDPATGIAVVYGTQVVPTTDIEVVALWDRLERALYAGLTPGGMSNSTN